MYCLPVGVKTKFKEDIRTHEASKTVSSNNVTNEDIPHHTADI